MPFYFDPFPSVKYDLKKNGKIEFLTNLTVRFKVLEVLKTTESGYYDYSIMDGETPDQVAFKFYEDPKSSWLIFLVNNIYDPAYDWPLSQLDFNKYIKAKYGSVPAAQAEVHEYRKIHRAKQVLFDGTIIPEQLYVIDQATYNTLDDSVRQSISKYDWELKLNDTKRDIKLVSPEGYRKVLSAIRDVFE